MGMICGVVVSSHKVLVVEGCLVRVNKPKSRSEELLFKYKEG